MRYACLDIWDYQSLFPLLKPFWAWPSCFLLNSSLFRQLLISSLWHLALLRRLALVHILIHPLLLAIAYVLESPEPRVHCLLLSLRALLRQFFLHSSLVTLLGTGCALPILHQRHLLLFDGARVLLVYDHLLCRAVLLVLLGVVQLGLPVDLKGLFLGRGLWECGGLKLLGL